MKRPRVDYDHLASSYNLRFEHDPASGVLEALQKIAFDSGAKRVLEAGCGTARFLAYLSSRVETACGLDLSRGMLLQAQERTAPLHLVQGRAGRLPFSLDSFDLIYCVNAIHHFDFPQSFIEAALERLRPGGRLAVIGSDPHAGGHYWYVYEYFEGVLETDLARFPTHPQILRWMEDAGLENLEQRETQHIHDEYRGQSVFEDPFLSKEATSQLALLSQEAYQAGLNRIRSDIEKSEASGDEMIFRADISIAMLSGVKTA